MKNHAALCCFLLFSTALQVLAQQPVIAPRDSVKAVFNGKKISIQYGKPTLRGRKIFGDVVKYYRVWRTGDGAATTFTTDVDLEMNGAVIPRGSYSLYTLPSADHWKLIINKQTGQWGTIYHQQFDLARIDLGVKSLQTTIEALTMSIEKIDNTNGIVKIEWEHTQLSAPFHISAERILPSPRDSVQAILHGKQISISYSRPSMRGRKIMGGVVPYGEVWRTGANAATSFFTSADLKTGKTIIPQGAYTLYSLPSSKQWQLIINKQRGQWGTVYNPQLDLVRLPLKMKKLTKPVETFTIRIEKNKGENGRIIFEWERTQLSLDFSVE